MRTRRWCCTAATSSNRATTRRSSHATAGTRVNGSTSNSRRASMPADSIATGGLPNAPQERRRTIGDATSLLLRAAEPARVHLVHGIGWLLVAAGLEALG